MNNKPTSISTISFMGALPNDVHSRYLRYLYLSVPLRTSAGGSYHVAVVAISKQCVRCICGAQNATGDRCARCQTFDANMFGKDMKLMK